MLPLLLQLRRRLLPAAHPVPAGSISRCIDRTACSVPPPAPVLLYFLPLQYHKCVKERGKDSGDCKPYMRAYR